MRRRQRKLRRAVTTAQLVADLNKKVQYKRMPWKLANAGPIGLCGYGMTVILLGLHNTGHYFLYSVIPSMAICYGGIAQIAAGLLEFTKGNTFGYVTFCSYGAFWLSLTCIWMLPNTSFGIPSEVVATSEYFLGVYMLLWAVFTLFMWACTIPMNVFIFLVYLSMFLVYLLLAIGHMAQAVNVVKAAGYIGIVCGGLSLGLAIAEVVNQCWDRTIIPVIPMTQLLGWLSKKDAEEEKGDDKNKDDDDDDDKAPLLDDG